MPVPVPFVVEPVDTPSRPQVCYHRLFWEADAGHNSSQMLLQLSIDHHIINKPKVENQRQPT